jgi:hypothetical protein
MRRVKQEKAVKIVRWELKELDVLRGGLDYVLPVWLKNSKLLKTLYPTAGRYHWGQLGELKGNEDLSEKRVKHQARRLFAIRLAVHKLLITHAGEVQDFERVDPFWKNLWWMVNCRPAGGAWINKEKAKVWYCKRLLCPWCWLRRHDLLYRGLKAPAGEKVTFAGRDIIGLGLGTLLHCLSFRAHGEGFYDNPAFFNEFVRTAALETESFRKSRTLLRIVYPMPDLRGATLAYFSDRPFENMTSGQMPFSVLPKGALAIHVTNKPLPFSRLMATRAVWAPEMLEDLTLMRKAMEVFAGRNLFNVSGG